LYVGLICIKEIIMRIPSLLLVAVMLILPANLCLAQGAPGGQAPVESVLTHIPSETMGAFVIHDIDGFIDKLDDFVADVMGPAANGFSARMYLSFILPAGGVNMDGDFAAIMLDPAEFGIDAVGEMRAYMEIGNGRQAPREPVVWPFVLFIPADSIYDFLPMPPDQITETTEGDVTRIDMGQTGESIYTATMGGYVLMAMRGDAIEAVLDADDVFEAGMSDLDMELINDSDISVYANMRTAGPLLVDLMEMFADEDPANLPYPYNELPDGTLDMYAELYRDMFEQMDAVNMMFTFTQTGLRFQEALVFAEESVMGEYVAAMPARPGSLLGNLPDNDYVVAMGARYDITEDMREMSLDQLAEVLEWEALDMFDDDVREQIMAIAERVYDQVNEIQFVAGGAPEGHGTVGAALVVDCDDASVLMGSLEDDMELMVDMINAALEDSDEEGRVSLSFVEGEQSVGGLAVTEVSLTIPDSEMTDEELEDIRAVLAMESPTFFVVSPDANTVIYTFGGDTAMIESVMASQGAAPSVASDAGVLRAMNEVAGEPVMLMSFSLGNLGRVGVASMLAVDPEADLAEWPLADMETSSPILIAASAEESTMYITAFVETAVIVDAKNSIEAYEAAQQERMMEEMQERQNDNGAANTPPETGRGPMKPQDEGF
jgi:hypothetical protein